MNEHDIKPVLLGVLLGVWETNNYDQGRSYYEQSSDIVWRSYYTLDHPQVLILGNIEARTSLCPLLSCYHRMYSIE